MTNELEAPELDKKKYPCFGADGLSIESECIDPEAERHAVRRADMIIMPITFLFAFLSHLDRSNLGNARVAGIQDDLNISDYQFSIALTMTFIPYIASELPISLVLKRVGAHILIPLLVTSWGLVTVCQAFVTTYESLLAARFFLGAIEGGLYPAMVIFVSNSYKREEVQLRIALFSAAAALSGAISGLLAYWFMTLDGVWNVRGWGWTFIIEGLFTVQCGLVGFLVFPRSLLHCRFLTPDQRSIVANRLKKDQPLTAGIGEEKFSWYQVLRAFRSPHVLLPAGSLFMVGSNLYGLAYFQPSIIRSFGYSPRVAQLVSVPPFAVGFLAMLFTSYFSDRYHARGLTAIIMASVAVVGYAMFMTCSSTHIRYASLFLSTAGIYSVSPTMYAWISNNSAPHYRQAAAIALGPICANTGGILSTWLFPETEEPDYPTATAVNLSFSVGIVFLCSLNLLWVILCNRIKAKKQRELLTIPSPNVKIDEYSKKELLRMGDRHRDFIYSR